MEKRMLIVFSLVLIQIYSLAAQEVEKPIISVLDFKTSGISESEAVIFVDFLSSHIIDTGMFRVIDRMQREAILQEMNFSYAGCTDETCQLEIGKMLAANRIVVGSIGRVGDRYLLTIRMIAVETGEAIKSGSEKYTSLNDLIDDSERLAKDFVIMESDDTVAAVAAAPARAAAVPRAVPAGAERKGGSIGARVGISKLSDAYSPDDVVIVGSVSGTFMYQFNNSFSFGAYLGAGTGIIVPPDTVNETLPLFGLILIIGNKVDDLALSVNLGIPFGVGLYFRNLYFGLGYLKIEDVSIFGAELGYSFYMGQ